jgi:hypothetical protein
MPRQLWFTTGRFQPLPGEDEHTNPGRYGKALADWVRSQLIAQGYQNSQQPTPEDWGWVVMAHRKPFPLWVGCGNQEGSSTRWGLFVEAQAGFVQKLLRGIDPAASVSHLEEQLENLVRSQPDFTDIAWEVL